MTLQIAFVLGAMAGSLFGCLTGVLIYYWIKFGSFGRAWCRVVHRHRGKWTLHTFSSRRCTKCGRDWHTSY